MNSPLEIREVHLRGLQGESVPEGRAPGSDGRFLAIVAGYSLFPIPYSLFPIPYSLFPIPYSLFPIPYSLQFAHSSRSRYRRLSRSSVPSCSFTW
jgi:hypothetical protein